MPELPEVETIRRGLASNVVGRTVTAARVLHPAVARPHPAAFAALVGRSVVAARRYGKHLFLDLAGDLTLAMHLRMTGQLRLIDAATERLLHTHLELGLDDGQVLRWRDVRRFGWLHVLPTSAVGDLPSLAGLGPDLLTLEEAEFSTRVRATRRMLKPLLLAQDVVCGLGNIYADETLWRARIHPRQTSDRLSRQRAGRLFQAIRQVLREAIEARGSSIDGEYVALDGFLGAYQLQHAVYGREGLPAPCCGRPVKRIVMASRSTFHCPVCQRRR